MAASSTPVSQLCFGAGNSELNLRAVSFLYAKVLLPMSGGRSLETSKTMEIICGPAGAAASCRPHPDHRQLAGRDADAGISLGRVP